MRAPLYVQLFSLIILIQAAWYSFYLPYGVKAGVASPVPFAEWVIKPREEDAEDGEDI